MNLDELRLEINKIDEEMLALFEKRMDVVKAVIEYKLKNDMPILDSKREDEVIKRNCSKLKNKEYEAYYVEFIKNNMKISKEFQNKIKESE